MVFCVGVLDRQDQNLATSYWCGIFYQNSMDQRDENLPEMMPS